MVGRKAKAVQVFVEGGGDENYGKRTLRVNLGRLAGKVLKDKARPTFVTCGSGPNTLAAFQDSLPSSKTSLLLVDSAEPMADPDTGVSPWSCAALKGKRPAKGLDDRCHLMVAGIEAWLLADGTTASSYYGKDFASSGIPPNPRSCSERELVQKLEVATRNCGHDKQFEKSHCWELIAKCDPDEIRRCPWADRFFKAIGG